MSPKKRSRGTDRTPQDQPKDYRSDASVRETKPLPRGSRSQSDGAATKPRPSPAGDSKGTGDEDTRAFVYVCGDRSIDVALIHRPKSASAGTRQHFAEYHRFDLKGGADHLHAMILGARRKPLTATVNVDFFAPHTSAESSSATRQASLTIRGTLIRLKIDPPTDDGRGGTKKWFTKQPTDSSTFFDHTIHLTKNSHNLKATSTHESSEFGVRPNLVRRAWEMHKCEITFDFADAFAALKKIQDRFQETAPHGSERAEGGRMNNGDTPTDLAAGLAEILGDKKPERVTIELSNVEFHANLGISVKVEANVEYDHNSNATDDDSLILVTDVGAEIAVNGDQSLPTVFTALELFEQTPSSDIPEPMRVPVYRRARFLGQDVATERDGHASLPVEDRSGGDHGSDSEHSGQPPLDDASKAKVGKLGRDGTRPSVVCVNDDGLGFASRGSTATWLKKVKETATNKPYWVIKAGKHASFNDPFYTQLTTTTSGYPDHCLAVTSADAIRAGSAGGRAVDTINTARRDGIRLSRDRSWESVVEDLLDAIKSNALMSRRGLPRHLLVLFGLAGCAYIDFRDQHSDPKCYLVFDPQHTEHDYAPEHRHGGVAGALSIFTAKVADWLSIRVGRLVPATHPPLADVVTGSGSGNDPDASELLGCCEDALRAARRNFDYGYGPSVDTLRRCADGDYPVLQIFHEVGQHKRDRFARMEFGRGKGLTPGNWSILGQQLRESERHRRSRSRVLPAMENRTLLAQGAFELGGSIIAAGLDTLRGKASSRSRFASTGGPPESSFPVLEIGRLVTVDRGEIEGLRTIQTVFEEYLRGQEQRPVSVAVFGAPGSGKSWGVTEVLRNLKVSKSGGTSRGLGGSRDPMPIIELNMSQFSESDHLASALLEVTNSCIDGKVPAVFFDEFDTKEGDRFRWISRFLSVMEDGQVFLAGKRVKIGRAILVFAGGIHQSFHELESPAERVRQAYRDQKVPDFVSRLMGYLNVAGPNPRSGDDTEVAQAWIRRAVQIRGHLERSWRQKRRSELAVDSNRFDVDPRVINALLCVDQYKHGSRSLRAVLDMCTFGEHESFDVSMVPTRSLLAMHVTDDFETLLAGN